MKSRARLWRRLKEVKEVRGVELLRREPAASAAACGGGVKYLGKPELGA